MELETREKPETRRSTINTDRQSPPRRPAAVPDRLRPTQRDLAFKNFGVMDAGAQDKKSVATSLVVNGSILALIIALSYTTKKMVQVAKVTTLTAPVIKEPPPPPKPIVKLPPPPIVKVTPPKPILDPPKIEVPEPPKIQPPVVKVTPEPVAKPTPAPPKAVTPPPAPKPVAISIAQSTSVANHDQHPSPVRLGSMTNPINNTAGPAVSKVNLGNSGAPSMNAANTGRGPASPINIGGSGSPSGTNMAGRANSAVVIKGVGNGISGATGPLNGKPAGAIQIAGNTPPPVAIRPAAQPTAAPKSSPKVMFKPRPEYTEEARQLHLEGTVYVKIHVSAVGSVQVIGVSSGLGHGLDQSAIRAVQGMRFQPAVQNGQPVDWDGVVNINFQLAS